MAEASDHPGAEKGTLRTTRGSTDSLAFVATRKNRCIHCIVLRGRSWFTILHVKSGKRFSRKDGCSVPDSVCDVIQTVKDSS